MSQSTRNQALKLAIATVPSRAALNETLTLAEEFFRFLDANPSQERVNALKYAIEFHKGEADSTDLERFGLMVTPPRDPETTLIQTAERFFAFLDPATDRDTLLDRLRAGEGQAPRRVRPSEKAFPEFAQHLQIYHPTRGQIPFEPYPHQLRIAQAIDEHRLVLINKARQMGVTQTMATVLLHHALRQPDQTILVVGTRFVVGQELMQRIRQMWESVEAAEDITVRVYARDRIEFSNGSKILAQAASENTGRGLSITHLYLDEFDYLPRQRAEECWMTLVVHAATGAKVIMATTPNRTGSVFHTLWRDDANSWAKLLLPWSLHPDRDAAWAEHQRSLLGDAFFAREFDCQFPEA